LYPDVNIKVLYGSDYRKLIEKFAGSSTSPHNRAEGLSDMVSAPDEPTQSVESRAAGEEPPPENEINE
jgi:hypothetical protein